ncbi:hypothetical protein SAMN02910456_00402 [Ruminococcaceae bacterium YRB3002]|nr:hypothetical protein SAMN02910456_00402 [Ruminococcaceae bacterium YRB3002]
MPNTQITNEVVKSIGVIAQNKSGWQREVNIIKWNEGKAKLDIRDWGPDHTKVGKGISLTKEEVAILKSLLEDIDLDDIEA